MTSPAAKPANGFIIVDKERDWTSFDVVAKLRNLLKLKKAGHGGTLDPNATGVLVICCGKGTRLSKYLLHGEKQYRATIALGQSTNTYDAEGKFTGEPAEVPTMSARDWHHLLEEFTGTIQQKPPAFSAIKKKGKPLYEYARRGKEVEIEPRTVEIHNIDLIEHKEREICLDVRSGSGVYIRSLAHDIGSRLGCGAYLRELRRTAAGPHDLQQAFTVSDIESMLKAEDYSFMKPVVELVPHLRSISLNSGQCKRITNGNYITTHHPMLVDREEVRLIYQEELLAIGIVKKPFGSEQVSIQPSIVLA